MPEKNEGHEAQDETSIINQFGKESEQPESAVEVGGLELKGKIDKKREEIEAFLENARAVLDKDLREIFHTDPEKCSLSAINYFLLRYNAGILSANEVLEAIETNNIEELKKEAERQKEIEEIKEKATSLERELSELESMRTVS